MSNKKNSRKYEYARKLLSECEDYAVGTELEHQCRDKRRELEGLRTKAGLSDQQMEQIETLKQALRNKQMSTAGFYLSQLGFRESDSREPGLGSSIMKIFQKIKSALTGDKTEYQQSVLRKEAAEADKKIFELQKQLASIVDKHAVLMKQIMQTAIDCTKLKPDSMEYRMKRQEALVLVPQVKAYENMIKQYSKVLENSSKYSSMLQTGIATAALKTFLPDLARAEAILGMISDETENIAENAREFEREYERYSRVADSSSDLHAFEDDDMFEAMVKKAQAEQEAQAAAHAQAEQEAQAAERAQTEQEAQAAEHAQTQAGAQTEGNTPAAPAAEDHSTATAEADPSPALHVEEEP